MRWQHPTVLLVAGFGLAIAAFAPVAQAQDTGPGESLSPDPARLPGQPPVGSPRYRNLRDEEDFSYLRAARLGNQPLTDFWDALKFLPLNAEGSRYVTLGGEIRPRWERFSNSLWGGEPSDNNGYLLQRYMLHGDVRLGSLSRNLTGRVFVQFKSGQIDGHTIEPGPADQDDFDTNQLFADLAVPLRPEASRSGEGQWPRPDTLTLRVGRQEMNFGSGRLISTREGPNVRIGFDGVRTIVRRDEIRTDLFAVRPVQTRPGSFDDVVEQGRELVGLYTVLPLNRSGHSNTDLDLYYLFYRRGSGANFDTTGPGRERRHSVGTRWSGQAGDWDFNIEGVGQWGRFEITGRPLDVRAWTIATDTGYTWKTLWSKPRLALKVDHASGDTNPNDNTLGTFNPLFPRGNYFGEVGILGPYNLTDVHPTLDMTLKTDVTMTLDWDFFWRASNRDGVYSFSGRVLRPGNNSRAHWIGHSPSIALSWQTNTHTNIFGSIGYFWPGRFLQETPPDRSILYTTTYVTYKF